MAYGYGNYTQAQVEAMIRAEATKRSIDPNAALNVFHHEGAGEGNYAGDGNSSFGPFQLHYGGVAQGGNSVGGLGDAFTKQTGLDARDPSTVPQQIQFSLDNAAKGGWGPWHGAQAAKMGNFDGIGGDAKPVGLLGGVPMSPSQGMGPSAPLPPDRPSGLLDAGASPAVPPTPVAATPDAGLLGAMASGGLPDKSPMSQGLSQMASAVAPPSAPDPVQAAQDPGIQRLQQQKQMAIQAAQKYLPPPPGFRGLLG